MFKSTKESEINKYKKLLEKANKNKEKIEAKEVKDKLDEYKLEKININIKCYTHVIDSFNTLDYKEAKIEKALTSEKKRRYQILNGNMLSTILMICIPLAIYAFFNSLYNLVDQIMANNISSKAVSNIAVISQLKNALNAFGAGLAGGGAVLVARYYGAGDIENAKKCSANLFLMSLILSAIIIILLMPLAYPILAIAQTPEINDGVILYFDLCMIEMVFTAINNIFMGLEKIKGNSKKLLLLNVMMLVIKLIFNVLFIYGFKVKTIYFLEIASIIGQLSLFSIAIFVMFSRKNMLQIKVSNMRPRAIYIKPIIKLSIPIFLGKFVMNIGKTIVNALCGSYYGAATDGLITGALGISNNLTGLVTSTTGVFEEGQSTVVSQNIGNKNLRRTIKAFKSAMLSVFVICLIGFVLVSFVFLDPLTNLFTHVKDAENGAKLARYVKEIYFYDCWSIPALGLTSVLLGLLYGYGKTFLSSILNFSRIGIRIVSLIICHASGIDYRAAGISMGISNVLIAVMSLVALIIFLTKLNKNGYKDMKLSDKEIEKASFQL